MASKGSSKSVLPDASKYAALAIDESANALPRRTPTGTSILEEGAIEENGRTYHSYKAGIRTYMLPNDGEEQDRLDYQHKIASLLMDDHLYWAPISNPRSALDIATGTGIWAMQFAQQHPSCAVTASDLSAIQPTNTMPNCQFVQEDADDDWTYGMRFDYIHFRFFAAFSTNLRAVLKRIYDHLEPGGWLEVQETTYGCSSPDGSWEGSSAEAALDAATKAMAAAGQNPRSIVLLKELFLEAGFVDVVEHIQPQPTGTWPADPKYKEIGRWNFRNALQGLEVLTKAITLSGRTLEEAQELVSTAQAEVWENRIRGYALFYVVYGRKPLPEERNVASA